MFILLEGLKEISSFLCIVVLYFTIGLMETKGTRV